MRNILAHDYFTRQSEIIWETLKAGLPELAAGCRAELARLGSRRLGGECPYRHRAHIASRCKGNRQLGHRIAVGHFNYENNVILAGRHIAAEEPMRDGTAQ